MDNKKDELRKRLHYAGLCERYIIDRRLEEGGIYFGQPPILHFLRENPNATQKEIADSLHISPASASVSLKRMEKSGIISRETDKTDARRNKLSLTEKGIQLDDFARQTFQSVDNAKLANLTDEEIETLLTLITKINNNLSELIPENCRIKQKEETGNA